KVWTLNTANVLPNNTVLGMYCDRDNNLWLALDKGIAMIQLNSSISYIHSFNPSIGSIYTLFYKAPEIYIGTNQGLYRAEWDPSKKSIRNLRLESNIRGQVWQLNQFDSQLFCGNNEQTYDVTTGARILSPVKGGMCICKGFIHGKEVLVQGTYTQLCIYEKKDGRWTFSHVVDKFLNPVRYLEIDYTGTIWASHLHQGLYAIQLTPDLKRVAHMTIFRSLDQRHRYPINVFSLSNRVVFTDNTAFYTYDDIKKKIVPFDELNKKLGYFSQAYRICHFKGELYWFIRDGEAALVEVAPDHTRLVDIVHYALFLNQTVDDYQNIIPVSETECLFTLENGLASYQSSRIGNTPSSSTLQMRSIMTSDDESRNITFLPLSPESMPKTPHSRNNILFTVFYPQYNNLGNLNYRYKLKGLDKIWSRPTGSSSKEYKYLPHGNYTLMVEVMTKSGHKLSRISYTFEVKPPFYWSLTARILYIILILLLIRETNRYIQRSFQIKKEKIRNEQEEIRRKEIEKREQQIIALKNDKLESELTV
ncbi:MAG: triple tyrosine motif-containing protein, partial [Bacteroidota bacterium]|nr:triple tyrosine motif-containing protein [Bacteroidota bacterium]